MKRGEGGRLSAVVKKKVDRLAVDRFDFCFGLSVDCGRLSFVRFCV